MRGGRELELLVAQLEKCISSFDSKIEIKSPDRIQDKITGKFREVDVSLRTTVGSSKILIIIECRDRKKVQDTTWIEQLATKREDVGADKAIAVSSKAFSEGAVLKAHDKNIELRTIAEITIDKISDWFKITALKNYTLSLDVYAVFYPRFPHRDLKRINSFLTSINAENMTDKKILIDQDESLPVSINELLQKKYATEISECVSKRIFKIKKQGRLVAENKVRGFKLLLEKKSPIINYIEYTVEFTVNVKESGIQSIKSYKTEDGTLADVIKFEPSDTLTGGQSFEMISVPDAENARKISIRIADNKSK